MASLQEAQTFAQRYGSYLMLLFFMAFQFSTVLTTVLSVLLGLLWLFTKQYEGIASLLRTQPIAAWSVLLFICFVIGLGYGNATEEAAFYSLGKNKKLLYIPILMIFFKDDNYKKHAWLGFVIASILTLLLSDLKAAGILNLNLHYASATIKNRITHSIFMAFFAFYCLHKAFDATSYKKLFLILALLALHNLFFVVQARTGQIVVLILLLLLAFQRFKKKGILLSFIVISLAMGLYLNFSDKATRIHEGINNTKAYIEDTLDPKIKDTSVAARYIFWEYSFKLIKERPVLGHGTGSFVQEYNRIAKGESKAQLHAHNELIMIGVQLGLSGILVYLGFIGSQFYEIKRLYGKDKLLGQGILLTLIVTSTFNCPIYDHAQGHWLVTLIALCFVPFTDKNSTESYA